MKQFIIAIGMLCHATIVNVGDASKSKVKQKERRLLSRIWIRWGYNEMIPFETLKRLLSFWANPNNNQWMLPLCDERAELLHLAHIIWCLHPTAQPLDIQLKYAALSKYLSISSQTDCHQMKLHSKFPYLIETTAQLNDIWYWYYKWFSWNS